ncbi:MAG TPA: enoyl-CoA hydratase/isomerase family protein [Thermoanaerobaculia bacterium]|nr:enoyl-CoA hydratase/isomerase family protein [Thermoanaerobaculia bacterium]
MTSPRVRVDSSPDGARADVRVDAPPVNVLDVALLGELERAIRHCAPPARLIVLRGLPRAFSAGVSVVEHVPEPSAIETMLRAMRGVLEALVDAPAVTLASVSGACLGGAAEILCACDLVLVADDARVGFPEIRLACFPPGAAALLPARIGEARAADWILSGEIRSGLDAAEAGLASRAVRPEALEAETERLAARVVATSPTALDRARELLRRARREVLRTRLAEAEDAYRTLAGSEDLARAVREFGRKS